MTTPPDITPELLRAVGSWLVQQPGSTDMALVEIAEQADRLERGPKPEVSDLLTPSRPIAEVGDGELLVSVRSIAEIAADHFECSVAEYLDDWAARIERRIERQRAESARIDQLAKVFHDASTGRTEPGRSTWDLLTPLSRDQVRAGIRAVLSRLEEDRSADAASESCTKPETPQVTLHAREPRTWNNLHYVPADVVHVTDVDGHILVRPARGWCAYISNPDSAPWTEVIADA